MAVITIDGKQVGFEGKRTILQVALDNNIEIPHYCYHPGLSIVASCRICLAEVAQPNPRHDNNIELFPKLMPACQTMATDNMVVYTRSPKAIANQKAVMEYLLINHPLDCPVCDQAGECHLQDYSYRYGRAESRFQEDKIKQPKKDIGPGVYLYADRCIMCSRCVRFTREVTGTGELGVFGRGNREQIDVFPGRPLDNELAGNVVDICPVGALLDKDFLFTQRVWYLSKTPSIDGITAGGDNLWIEHNQGHVYRVKPRANPQVNQWWISDEVRYGWKFVHREDRLTTPMRRQFGSQDPTDWPRAYLEVRDRFTQVVQTHGPGSLAVMVSPMLTCEEAYLLGRMIRGLDPQSRLAVGPVPVDGQDKRFPGGYTVRAEKCPNSRGVRRALELVADYEDHSGGGGSGASGGSGGGGGVASGGGVLSYEQLIVAMADKADPIAGVMCTGNYPSAWVTKDLLSGLKNKFVVLIDTLPSDLARAADVLLPGATWVEKAGSFENVQGRLQGFEPAIPVLEGARPEGQIALDLAAVCSREAGVRYDPQPTRRQMGGVFATEVHPPSATHDTEPAMQYVEL